MNEFRVGVNALTRDSLPTNAGTDGFAALGVNALFGGLVLLTSYTGWVTWRA